MRPSRSGAGGWVLSPALGARPRAASRGPSLGCARAHGLVRPFLTRHPPKPVLCAGRWPQVAGGEQF